MTELTYGQLDKILRLLGFSARVTVSEPKARVYEHKQTGALLAFPAFSDDETVLSRHLDAVRGTLDGFGIPVPGEFAAKLQRAS